MQVEETNIRGVLILVPKVFEDPRGFFYESYNQRRFADIGIDCEFVQDNHSRSVKGVVRGLHYQKQFPQGKLIRAIQGAVLDVVVDIRNGSPTFGQWISVLISAENKKQVWIPRGLAHGFSVVSDTAEFCYKVDEFYHPEDEAGIHCRDPQLRIDWGVTDPMLSKKDQALPFLADIDPETLPAFE